MPPTASLLKRWQPLECCCLQPQTLGVLIAVPGSAERVHLPLQVVVRDNGPGIPEEVRPTLFEPFVTTKRGGQGLGLALVAKLVADQGGLIECDSRPGRTSFRLSLPAPPRRADQP